MRFDDRQSRGLTRQQRRALERKQTKQRRSRFIGPLGAALLGTAIFSPTAGAATITVNSNADTVATDTLCTLREALLNANNNALTVAECLVAGQAAPVIDVIQFSVVTGTITLNSGPALVQKGRVAPAGIAGPGYGELLITDSVDIQGPGPGVLNITAPSSNIFRVSNYVSQIDVTISGLKLNNSAGTAVQVFDENLNIDNVLIDNNTGGGIAVSPATGATVMVDNSTITNNSTSGGAGIFMQQGSLTIDNSNISGNTSSSSGGGIAMRQGTLTITGSTISGNTATYGEGGGVYMEAYNNDLHLSVTSSTISGNTAARAGGGIYFGTYLADSSFTLTNSTVSGNMTPGRMGPYYSSRGYGGGLRVSASTLSITGSFIQDNIASGNGGGVLLELDKYAFTGPFEITDTTISGNTAGRRGGGLYASADSPGLTLQNVDVLNNTAGTSGVSGGGGGGLSLYGVSTITDSTITGNRAIGFGSSYGTGGGILFNYSENFGGGSFTITNSTIDDNIADREGGGIYVEEDIDLTVIGGSISGNSATGVVGSDGAGGGIFFYAGDLTLTNATISGNTAGTSGVHEGRGGGIYLYAAGASSTITGSTITLNTAFSVASGNGGLGGGIYLYDGYLDVAGSSISNNVAEAKGGGVYMYGAYLTVTAGSTISGNKAGKSGALAGKGGGVYMYGGSLFIANSAVTGNTAFTFGAAGGQGGGINLYNGYLYLAGSSVSTNVAGGSGGGIYMYNGYLTTLASSISANTSGGNGGGIFALYAYEGLLKETTISGNTAAGFGGGLAIEGGQLPFNLENVTVANNTASGGDGGGIHTALPIMPPNPVTVPFIVRNSTVAANNAPAGSGGNLWTDSNTRLENSIVADGSAALNPDIATGTVGLISSFFSLIESPGATPFTDQGGTITGDPQLGPLAANGGPTLTKRQADTSPVVNTGDPAFVPPPATDQRGFPRVVDSRIDMGAVEIVQSVGTDLEITKSGPASVAPGSAISYNVIIKNLGPASASGVVVNDSFSAGLIYEFTTTPCGGGFPCAIGNIASGSSVSFTVNFTADPTGRTTSLTNSASASSTTFDPASSNNTSSATTAVCPPTGPELIEPVEGSTIPSNPVTFRFNTIPVTSSYQLYAVVSSSPAPIFLGSTTTGTLTADVPAGAVTWYVDAFPINGSCGSLTSERGHFTLTGCPVAAPELLSPSEGAVVSSNPVTFRWTAVAGASGGYQVFFFQSGFSRPQLLGQTTDTSLVVDVPLGAIEWYVEPVGPAETCTGVVSARGHFTQTSCVSAVPAKAPEPAILGESTSTETYEFSWTFEGPDDTTFEVQESLDNSFTTLVSPPRLVTLKKAAFVHEVERATGYFYQVRAVRSCIGQPIEGPFSVPVRIVVVPPPPPAQPQPDQTQQFGLPDPLVQEIFIPGEDDSAPSLSPGGPGSLGNTGKPITVTTSQPWLTASPVSVTVPPQGVVITVTAVPVTLPVGTNTGTVLVTTPSPTGGAVPLTNVPISVNLVTPVTPTGKVGAPPQNTIVLPSVSHVDGLNANYQSDVRIANLSGQKVSYQVSFTPSRVDGTTTGRQTLIDIEPGATTALDDIVKRLYGFGSLGDGVLGSLEIRPLNFNAPGLTVASSRTYNNRGIAGSLSQFVPSVPISSFVFKGTGSPQQTILSMQQIAQTGNFRTNLGIVEGSGQSATAQVTIFGIDGRQLDTFFLSLKPAEHVQIGSVLATRGINNLSDGRIEVQLTSDTGRITAFATVIDSRSGDPLLVPGVQLSKIGASRYVVPGVTHISNDRNQWRTEMRIFNASSAPETATLTFIPANNPAGATSRSISIAPGEVRPIENIVESVFGFTNITGAIHVTTPTQSSLVVTSRTFDSKLGGQVGQFSQAVTAAEANGLGDRALQVLQLEESDRFRTNLGVAEVTGNSVDVEITAVLPDAKVAPVIRLTLQPNEFRQIGSILRQMGLSEAYNARLSLKVIGGAGRITAYGSVIDSVTQDPYTVQGQ